jgi:hypothetical protein
MKETPFNNIKKLGTVGGELVKIELEKLKKLINKQDKKESKEDKN